MYLLLLDFILAAISVFTSGRSYSNRTSESVLAHSPSSTKQKDIVIWTARVKSV